jgi:hypothetical protein
MSFITGINLFERLELGVGSGKPGLALNVTYIPYSKVENAKALVGGHFHGCQSSLIVFLLTGTIVPVDEDGLLGAVQRTATTPSYA